MLWIVCRLSLCVYLDIVVVDSRDSISPPPVLAKKTVATEQETCGIESEYQSFCVV